MGRTFPDPAMVATAPAASYTIIRYSWNKREGVLRREVGAGVSRVVMCEDGDIIAARESRRVMSRKCRGNSHDEAECWLVMDAPEIRERVVIHTAALISLLPRLLTLGHQFRQGKNKQDKQSREKVPKSANCGCVCHHAANLHMIMR